MKHPLIREEGQETQVGVRRAEEKVYTSKHLTTILELVVSMHKKRG